MSVLGLLRTHLLGHAGLAALVGDRVYADTVPLAVTLPAISYLSVDDIPTNHRSSRNANHTRSRIQIDVFAANRQAAQQVRTQVLAAMGTFKTAGPPQVQGALRANGQSDYTPENSRFRCILDFYVWHRET